MGGPNIYIKRDDLLGLAGGGNKTRKLEFVVADALRQGADTLITCGAVQSNHCRLTLAAAIREGLKCRLVLEERVPNSYDPEASGNNFLYHLMGVEKVTVVPKNTDMIKAMEDVAGDLTSLGRKPYIIQGGASDPLGALGYVVCAQEILNQTFEMGLPIHKIVCASGSGGTQSGLIAGFVGTNSDIPVAGINVSRAAASQKNIVYEITHNLYQKLNIRSSLPSDSVICFDDYVGPGYSLPTPAMVETVNLLAKLEGILLDPVYTGKAFAGLIDLIKKGFFKPGENILFVHTGGIPALYVYKDILLQISRETAA